MLPIADLAIRPKPLPLRRYAETDHFCS